MAGLKSSTKFVRRELGQRIRLRRTPEVVFYEDRSLELGDRTLSLINQLSAERAEKGEEETELETESEPDQEN
jgi:ribosome-binding factor A